MSMLKPRLMQELPIAKADGRYPKLLREFGKAELLVLDDWGLMPMNDDTRRDLPCFVQAGQSDLTKGRWKQ